MRSGTLNVPGIVGLGKAVEIANRDVEGEAQRMRGLRDSYGLASRRHTGVELNGHPTQRLPNNLSVAIPGIESRSLWCNSSTMLPCPQAPLVLQ
jgi:cysteine desulfurase